MKHLSAQDRAMLTALQDMETLLGTANAVALDAADDAEQDYDEEWQSLHPPTSGEVALGPGAFAVAHEFQLQKLRYQLSVGNEYDRKMRSLRGAFINSYDEALKRFKHDVDGIMEKFPAEPDTLADNNLLSEHLTYGEETIPATEWKPGYMFRRAISWGNKNISLLMIKMSRDLFMGQVMLALHPDAKHPRILHLTFEGTAEGRTKDVTLNMQRHPTLWSGYGYIGVIDHYAVSRILDTKAFLDA